MQAKAKRRHNGRLRPLTNEERDRRQERRERLNPEREATIAEAIHQRVSMPHEPRPALPPVLRSGPKVTEAAKRDPHYPRKPLTERGLALADETTLRGGKRSRRRTTRVWR